jgi:hypothetical protein
MRERSDAEEACAMRGGVPGAPEEGCCSPQWREQAAADGDMARQISSSI